MEPMFTLFAGVAIIAFIVFLVIFYLTKKGKL